MRGASMVLLLLGLLVMAQLSIQQDLRNPIRIPSNGYTANDLPPPKSAFGIIVTSYSAEKALNDSGHFHPYSHRDLFGRRFVKGKIYGAEVVYVKSAGTPSIHVGMTLQIMVDYFDIHGIIHYGSAGTTNETIDIGAVVAPRHFIFTGAFEWLSKDSNKTGELKIGDFNYPEPGENLLGSFLYEKIDLYLAGHLKERYRIPVNPRYLITARQIPSYEPITFIMGLNASSSDIYVNNPAYREFLYKNIRVSTVDTSGIAVALGAWSNNLPYIVFHGVSNKAGAGSGESNSTLANENAVKAVTRFIWLRTVPRYT